MSRGKSHYYSHYYIVIRNATMNKNLKIEYVPIGDLKAYERNAKLHPQEQIQQIKNSILEFGFNDPIAVWKDNEIIEGHGRLIAAQELCYKEIPIIRLDGLSDEQRKAYMLAHNKLTMNSGFDIDLLNFELATINGIDMTDFGFEFDFGFDEAPDVVEDNFEEELAEEPVSQLGDIYQLGQHRLMCGDSTCIEQVKSLLNGEQADIFLTDPPYNVNYTGGTKDALKILNDSMEDSRFRAFLSDAFNNADTVMKPGAAFYIWHADSEGLNFRYAATNTGWKIRQCLVWVKNALVLGRQDYQWKHEPCLYGWKDGTHYFTEDRTQATVIDDKIDLKKLKKEEMLKLLQELYSDKVQTTVLYEDKPLVNDVHPTMKPIRLMGQLIKNSTKPQQIVLDLFGGSGSTMIACEQLGRICYTMELDPKYVDVIIDRWEKFTGQRAKKLN